MDNTRNLRVVRRTVFANSQLQMDQIGLQPGMYRVLFGRGFEKEDRARPWKRGIITVSHTPDDGAMRTIRLLFRGVAADGVTQETVVLPNIARQQLGIRDQDAVVNVRIEPNFISRPLFYWNHLVDSTRVSFKLGSLALLIAMIQFL